MSVITVTLNPALDLTVEAPSLRLGEVNKARSFYWNPGGKGINVAGCLADFNVPVAATGFLGEKNISLFEEFFQRKKIEDRFVRHAGATRVNIKIADVVQQQTTDINSPSDSLGEESLESLKHILSQNVSRFKAVVFAGSLPETLDDATYEELIRALKAQGLFVALDSSGAPLANAVKARPDLIKPNHRELEILCGKKLHSRDEVLHEARKLIERGLGHVVISLGAEGALFLKEHEVWAAAPLDVKVTSTVGAGDAMMAGVVAGLMEGRSWGECACLGVAFASGKLRHRGAVLPPRNEVEELARQVKLTLLEEGRSHV